MTHTIKNVDKYLEQIDYICCDLWPSFDGKQVFIAGNSGFLGSWFETVFDYIKRKRGVKVEVYGLSRQDGWHIDTRESYGDYHARADFVINCAGSSGTPANPTEALWTHGVGPLYLFSQLKPGARGLQLSSGACGNETPYGAAKAVSESGLLGFMPAVTIARLYAVVGPSMGIGKHFAISTFIKRTLLGEPLEVSSDRIVRSYAFISDVMCQLFHALLHGSGVYNVGSDDPISIEQAARCVSDKVLVVTKDFASNADSNYYVPNLSHTKHTFDLQLEYTSSAAIRETYQWYKYINDNTVR